MQKYANSVQDTYGNAIEAASVTVYLTGTTTVATIYADNGVTVTANPQTTNSLGEFSFYAADGRYDITVTKTGITTQNLTDILLFDPNASTGSAYVNFLQSGTGATATNLQTHLRTYAINARTFAGCVWDGTTDDTTPFAAALAAAKAAGKPLYVPAGSVKVTLSLDGTFADGGTGQLVVFGDGKHVSNIIGELSEQYPILDFTGNTRGRLFGITIKANTNTSKATCAFLAAKVGTGSQGNVVDVDECALQLPTSGNSNSIAGAVFFNTDLSRIGNNVECYGPTGATMGFGKSSSVTSKFQTISATTDSTLLTIGDNCAFEGDSGPAFGFTGGAALRIGGSYFTLVGTGAGGKVIEVSSTTTSSGNAIYADGIRTENQASTAGASAIYFTNKCLAAVISGSLETDASGAMFGSASTMEVTNMVANVTASQGSLFALSGGVSKSRFMVNGVNSLGTIGDTGTTNTYDLEFAGSVTESSIVAVLGGIIGLKITQGANCFRSLSEQAFAPGTTPVLGRYSANIGTAGISTTAYTGGSGEQSVYSATIHGVALGQWNSQLPSPAALIEDLGTISSAAAASGRIRVNLSQGAGNVDVLDTGANISAFASGGTLRLSVKPICVGTTNSRCYTELVLYEGTGSAGQRFAKYTNTQATIVFNADFTLTIYVTNTGSSPYSFDTETQSIY